MSGLTTKEDLEQREHLAILQISDPVRLARLRYLSCPRNQQLYDPAPCPSPLTLPLAGCEHISLAHLPQMSFLIPFRYLIPVMRNDGIVREPRAHRHGYSEHGVRYRTCGMRIGHGVSFAERDGVEEG